MILPVHYTYLTSLRNDSRWVNRWILKQLWSLARRGQKGEMGLKAHMALEELGHWVKCTKPNKHDDKILDTKYPPDIEVICTEHLTKTFVLYTFVRLTSRFASM